MAGRYALIVATDHYDDPKLRALRSPAEDAEALERVLRDPGIGNFEVQVARNEPEWVLRQKVSAFLCAGRRTDDTLLLHFSCHGVKDDNGRLFFASPNTSTDNLKGTAIAASWLDECIEDSRSRKVLLVLDCCYSGAFSGTRRARAGHDAHPLDPLRGGTGRVVLTATSDLEYAWEGDSRSDEPTPSVFTSALVQGLETGEADRDGDRLIGVDELYRYICDRLLEDGVPQRPGITSELRGEALYVARSTYVRVVPLRDELAQLLQHPITSVRLGLVADLFDVARAGGGEGISARAALKTLASEDDSLRVRHDASTALETLGPEEGEGEEEPPAVAAEEPPVAEQPAAAPPPPPVAEETPVAEPSAAAPPPPPLAEEPAVVEPPAAEPPPPVAEEPPLAEEPPPVAAPEPVAPQPAAPEPPAPPLWAGDAARERVVVWHEDAVLAVAFGPDVLITGGRDGTARVWRPDGEAVATLAAREWVLAVAASGDRVVTAGRERGVRVWEVATATEVVAVRCDLAWDVAFSPDGATLATAGADGAVGLWEAATGHKLAELAHGAPVTALRFSDDGLLLATASGGDARVWSLAERRELVRIDAGAPVRALAFSADHRPLALTGGAAFPTRVLDVHDGGDSLTLAPAGMRVAAFDATGQRVAAAGAEPEVVVFDARSGAELGRIPTPAVPSAIAFRPDGHALAIGARDGGTRVWTDVATPAPA